MKFGRILSRVGARHRACAFDPDLASLCGPLASVLSGRLKTIASKSVSSPAKAGDPVTPGFRLGHSPIVRGYWVPRMRGA